MVISRTGRDKSLSACTVLNTLMPTSIARISTLSGAQVRYSMRWNVTGLEHLNQSIMSSWRNGDYSMRWRASLKSMLSTCIERIGGYRCDQL